MNTGLICPICGSPLVKKEKSAYCENGHCFDYAKSGYLNLTAGAHHGDDREMVKARTAFLQTGAYGFLRDALKETCRTAGTLVDLGCGEGWYTRQMEAGRKFGIDLSKDALKTAARKDPDTTYVSASIFHLPLPDACADVVLTCFAPFAKEEIRRILKPEGKFVYVTPGPDHLMAMKEVLYEHPYRNVVEPLETKLTMIREEQIENTFHADQEALLHLFLMTPYAYKTGIPGTQRLKEKTDGLDLTAQFVIRVYQKS